MKAEDERDINELIAAVRGIIIFNGMILIIQRSADDSVGAEIWEFPGGGIEFGEGLQEALSREVKEETGLTVTADKLLYATTFLQGEHRQILFLTYLCTVSDSTVILSDEHKDYKWVCKEQLPVWLAKPIIDSLEQNSVWDLI